MSNQVQAEELHLICTGENVFSREPAFGCFVAGNFDFVLAAYHALWGGGDIDDISAAAMLSSALLMSFKNNSKDDRT